MAETARVAWQWGELVVHSDAMVLDKFRLAGLDAVVFETFLLVPLGAGEFDNGEGGQQQDAQEVSVHARVDPRAVAGELALLPARVGVQEVFVCCQAFPD